MEQRVISAWWYVLGGTALGTAIGLLVAPRVLESLNQQRAADDPREDTHEEAPTAAARVLRSISQRVKIAGAQRT